MSQAPDNANEGCVGPESENAGKASACAGCPNQTACASGKGREVDPAVMEVADKLSSVKHTLLVLSGKGGVGKSTFSAQLAWYLATVLNKQVGLLDIDICGPSQPHMTGVGNEEVHRSSSGWSPVYAHENLGVMSVGFMLSSKNDAIIWRGPRKNALIKQFLTEVDWSDLDFLVIDAPPGTSDEHISIAQYLKQSRVDGCIILTTPQEVALLDVRKEISFCQKVKLPVLGVVENMSGFICPCCQTRSEIFVGSSGGAAAMSAEMGVPFLGAIPLDPRLVQACERGQSFFAQHLETPTGQAFQRVIQNILQSSPEMMQTAAPASDAPAAAPAQSMDASASS
eukprot:TRINITY_DN549_c0_g2_i2.p1 TRINITY_DN549_c0_g2~~TRINITY_DN549_c0_g2_i2.p1  ORF type:complete len:340 (+),score=91.64 TRINITY_DN549_c0_g2_i2:118-1137(+)